jgi:hypothetical protein
MMHNVPPAVVAGLRDGMQAVMDIQHDQGSDIQQLKDKLLWCMNEVAECRSALMANGQSTPRGGGRPMLQQPMQQQMQMMPMQQMQQRQPWQIQRQPMQQMQQRQPWQMQRQPMQPMQQQMMPMQMMQPMQQQMMPMQPMQMMQQPRMRSGSAPRGGRMPPQRNPSFGGMQPNAGMMIMPTAAANQRAPSRGRGRRNSGAFYY